MDSMFGSKESSVEVTSDRDYSTGHHSARFEVEVKPGEDANKLADAISTKIAESPAPFSPHNEPSEMPTLTSTIGQPSYVSKASSADGTDHVVMVEASEDHILAGKDGAAGITYHTFVESREDGRQVVVTEKESYGDSSGATAPLRAFVGDNVLNPHLESGMNQVVASHRGGDDK